jgi:hypothetical protein
VLAGTGPGEAPSLVPLTLDAEMKPSELPAYGRILLDVLTGLWQGRLPDNRAAQQRWRAGLHDRSVLHSRRSQPRRRRRAAGLGHYSQRPRAEQLRHRERRGAQRRRAHRRRRGPVTDHVMIGSTTDDRCSGPWRISTSTVSGARAPRGSTSHTRANSHQRGRLGALIRAHGHPAIGRQHRGAQSPCPPSLISDAFAPRVRL